MDNILLTKPNFKNYSSTMYKFDNWSSEEYICVHFNVFYQITTDRTQYIYECIIFIIF